MAPTPSTDEEYVAAIASGDEGAIDELLARYWERAHRVAFQLTGDADAAEDVAQEAFVKVLRGAARFDAARSFRPWFFGIVRNEARQHRRTQARRAKREGVAAKPDRAPSTFADAGEAVQTYLARLSAKHREPLVLHYLEGFTHQEIADLLDWPRTTVATRIKRGLRSLRQDVQPTFSLGSAALVELLRQPVLETPGVPSAVEVLAAAGGGVAPKAPAPPSAGALAHAARRAPPGVWIAAAVLALLTGGAGLVLLSGDEPPAAQAALPGDPPGDRLGPPESPGEVPTTGPEFPASPEADPQPAESADPVATPDATSSEPEPESRTWRWGAASTVTTTHAPGQGLKAVSVPVGLLWVNDRLHVVTQERRLEGISSRVTAQLWRRSGDAWESVGEPVLSRDGLFTKAVALGRDVGLLGGGGYRSDVWFYRLSAYGQVLREERLLETRGPRLTVATVSVEADRLLTVSVLEQRKPPQSNRFLLLRSHDLGSSWAPPVELETTTNEDWCRIRGFQWSERELSRLSVEKRGREVKLLSSSDGALSWTSAPVELHDDLAPDALRLPLEAIQLGDVAAVVYLGMHKGAPGRYYFTRSLDHGATWEPGTPITPPTPVDDVSRLVQLARANGQVVFSYIQLTDEGERRQRFLRSDLSGATWAEIPVDDAFLFPFVQLQGGTRSIVLAGMRKLPGDPTQAELFVRELVAD